MSDSDSDSDSDVCCKRRFFRRSTPANIREKLQGTWQDWIRSNFLHLNLWGSCFPKRT